MNTYSSQVRVGIAGATGYAGQELVALLARHPGVRLTTAMSSSADSAARPLPRLNRLWDGQVEPLNKERLAAETDLTFLAVPENAAAELAPPLVDKGVRVIDLSGAFRIKSDVARHKWYPATKELPDGSAYGLTEFFKSEVKDARLVANPGCYPTAALLSLMPLGRHGLLLPNADIIIDAKSGISGAGRAPSDRTHFSENHGSVAAYGVLNHRHVAEMEQALASTVTFVPHLVPLDRGILETIYVKTAAGTTNEKILDAFQQAYANEPFVRLTGDALPEIKHVAHTNFCDIGWRFEPSTNRLVMVSVIDNLVKGAAGQALQNFNVAFGFDERTGLL
ncbi:MAG TPA: N-acetyl-gamma-glutamyl-phosphate reductase [Vicinamibacterales bacterium]|nr:N-acetyl-gamma-glutamyl-phosphate reductase [Vicinamibacterales bacterium]